MEQKDFIQEARLEQCQENLLTLLLEEEGMNLSSDEAAITPRKHREDPPLSYSQQAQWILHQLEPDNPFYNICATIHLTGVLDLKALEQSLKEMMRRHEILRTTFTTAGDQPIQVINAGFSLPPLLIVDLQDLSTSEQAAETKRLAAEMAQHSFDLTRAPLFRFTLLRLGGTSHVLLLVIHHIISDGFTLGIFVQELGAVYDAFVNETSSPLPELPIQYADYAVWQRQRLQGDRLETLLNYWKHQLADIPPLLDLPSDRSRPAICTFRGDTVSFHLDHTLTQQLIALSQTSGTTLFMTLLAGFTVLLYRYSNQSDVVVGAPIANRRQPELENLIGFFANTLVLRTQFSEGLSFRQLLAQVRHVTLDAYAHQDLPFEILVDELQPERVLNSNPLVQVMFVLQNAPLPLIELPNLTISPAVNLDTGTVRADLEVQLWQGTEGISGDWVYSVDLFDRTTIQRMMAHFRTLLEAIVANPDQSVSLLPLLTPAERHQLLTEWNDTQAEYCQDRCIHQQFETQVDRTPDAVALVFEDQQLTYQELNRRANQLAHHLQALGVGPEVLVGICVERSLEMLIGLLGILKAGGAYVPLDPTYPPDRLAFMLEDSQVSVLVTQVLATQEKCIETLPECIIHRVRLDQDWETISRQNQDNLGSQVKPENLAYVIYTSGSTGNPKGVLVSHNNVTRLFAATQSWFQFDDCDVWTLFHSYAFDFSVWEIWGALLHGGKLIIVPWHVSRSPEIFYDLLCAQQVTVLNQTPSAFRQLIREEAYIEASKELSLRLVIFGGEALERQSLRPWFERHGGQFPQLVNMYGITEATVHVTYRPLSMADLNRTGSLIGAPIPDLQVYIVDSHLQLVPIGVVGEICIGGAGVSRGYLNRPELSAEKFIPNLFLVGSRELRTANREPENIQNPKSKILSGAERSHVPKAINAKSKRLYKTGDLARYLANGDIEFLGRIDHQVKIRGFRIELGEIEAVLAEHPAVQQTVVTVHEEEADDKRLGLFRAFGEAVRSLKILRLPTSSADHAVSPESSTQS